ncbi:MAG: zinc-ribbon domain-containing protein [Eubacteriales bacterium]|nr:zinc-ribbon domain-containing protein [Eubacteriales bacterium]
MAFCAKCGKELAEGEKFCASCGEPVAEAATVVDTKAGNNDTLMGVLSYLGILSLIPYFIKDQTSFVRYHAVRGLNLFLLELIASAAAWIVGLALSGVGTLLSWIVSVAGLAFAIIGIVNVANHEKKDLPLIGGIQFVKE